MAKFSATELVDTAYVQTMRLGAGPGAGNTVTSVEVGKFVKLVGDVQYDNCTLGDAIEGRITSVEPYTADAYSIGGVMIGPVGLVRFQATCDGLQGTPGTGTIAVGDFVVCGTPVAKGTALTFPVRARVCKATAAPAATASKWRVVGLGGGSGAPGTSCYIERV